MFLVREDRYFRKNRWRWIAQGKEGQYVAVHADQVGGFYPSRRQGLLAGLRRWAPSLFLVRQVTSEDPGDPFDWLTDGLTDLRCAG